MIETVTKRDGTIEEFDADKLNKWAIWASENCNVSWSDVVFGAIRKVYNNVTTEDLQKALIKTCIEFKTDEHTKVAARLLLGLIYKEAFEDFSVPSLSDFYHNMINQGRWDDMGYSEEELEYLDGIIDHTIDFTYSYATLKQFVDKYVLKSGGKILENPQMAFMGIAMSNMRDETNRLSDVKLAYEKLAGLKINLPTPTLSLERTESKPAPSCCTISGGDTVESIGAATHVAYDMTARSAGIGWELETRAPKDPVKNGRVEHGGKHSYYAYLDRAVKANRQIVRGGSATVTYNVLDPEIEDLLTMRSQRTDPTYRLDQLDYSLAMNHLFLKKVARNEMWMSVSPYFAPKLWELSYSGNPEAFEEEYDRVFHSTVKKKVRPARDVIKKWITARGDHGRLYATLLDNVNMHTPFKEPIRLSNLCQEIAIVTKPFDDVSGLYNPGANGEVGLCNIAAVVITNIKDDTDYEETTYITAKIVDNCIERGIYPFPHIEHTAKARRSIGIGITDFAHYMVKNGKKYTDEDGRNFMHLTAERHSYFLHKASVKLAKERGRCEWFEKTKYSDDNSWLPVDTYIKAVDELHSQPLTYDWESLRDDIKKNGVRFSVLEAFMPTESSSVFTNSTNGLYPVRSLEIYKSSPKGMVYFRAPGMDEYEYENAYRVGDESLVALYSIFQKFTGQSISSDFYSIVDGNENMMSLKNMTNRLLKAAKYGMKTFYYENFSTSEDVENMASGGDKEMDCETCDV